jgi:hypothetical protein
VRIGRRERIEARVSSFTSAMTLRFDPNADQDLMLAMFNNHIDNVGDRFFQRDVKMVEDTRRKLVDHGAELVLSLR